ncbi:MAG: hypothetical protein ACYTFY_16510 [Planctomycetota bacterium]|jgi:hypothetical protein
MTEALKTTDTEIMQELAKEYAEIAALPVQEEKRKLWRKLNGLQPERPMVMVDQVCWNEMDYDGSLTEKCEDPFLRSLETVMRRKIFQWKNFPVDMVFDPWISIQKVACNSRFGIELDEDTVATDPHNAVVSHKYNNLFQSEEDLERIKTPVITHDEKETERRINVAQDLFNGIIDVRVTGISPYVSLWDPLATWMNVEEALFAMIDKPDLIHGILSRMTDGYLSMLDQLEEKKVLTEPQSLIHCTGGYTDELPADGYDPNSPRCSDIWMYGLAQMLGTVSPEMYDEFEIKYTSKICERFGLVYYGCCDPLDNKMEQVRKLPNVRKVSVSPWANQERSASEIKTDFVFSSKPNPANVAMDSFNGDLIRKELSDIKALCDQNSCPLEFILKDISTLCREPDRLNKWAEIAMDIACS